MPAAALFCLLILAAAMPASSEEPPCTDESCEVGGSYCNATVDVNVSWNSVRGNFTIMLYEQGAPLTAQNFIKLTATKFYDGCKFHRCIDDFVAQTGDPNSKNDNPYDDGYGGSDQTIPLEINDTLTHIDGALGMARGQDPNSASSQFYICDGAQHGLDGNYAVFGFVTSGIDVVRAIAAVPVNGNRRPLLSEQPVDDVWLYGVSVNDGYWNETEPTGPSEPVIGGGILGGAGGSGVAALVAVPALMLIAAFLLIRWRKRRLMVKVLSAAYR